METFYSTTGMVSEAGECLWQELDEKNKSHFMSVFSHFKSELLKAQSGLAGNLLYNHFMNRVKGRPMETFQLNVLKAMWSHYGKHLHD